MPFTDTFKKLAEDDEFLHDIDIYICDACEIVQTQHNVGVEDYYEEYEYAVGDSPFARNFMTKMAAEVDTRFVKGKQEKKVLEIGSGDGGQLEEFEKLGFTTLGFEPSSKLCEIARNKGIETIQGLFSAGSAAKLGESYQNVDIVYMSYTFDHIPNPLTCLREIKKLLTKNNGYLIFEIHNVRDIFLRNEYCLFEHEHSIYLDEYTVGVLLKKAGFDVVALDLVDQKYRRANSLIVAAQINENSGPYSTEFKSLTKELKFDLQKNIDIASSRIHDKIREYSNEYGKIYAYGAGGRGVMTLANLRSADAVAAIFDSNKLHAGKFAPKTKIKVLHSQDIPKGEDAIFIVFSYGYIEEIAKQLEGFGYTRNQIVSILDILAEK